MIYYFSGTGNSRYAARYLSRRILEPLRFIPLADAGSEIPAGESIGFVFPVYSWGVPPLVLDFIKRLTDQFWEEIALRQIPIWCVMTCGDEVALAPEMMENALKRRGAVLSSIWSVIMPNNYVILPGFDVDPEDVEKRKLDDSPVRLDEISNGILEHRPTIDVVRGSMPWIKTKLVYPLFRRWGIFPEKWHVSDKCINCGKCAEVCPLKNITMEDGKPHWGIHCCSCLACYHNCPVNAIQYSSFTKCKGQYHYRGK